MKQWLSLVLVLLGTAAPAQIDQPTVDGVGAILRTLDRINGQVQDYDVAVGSSIEHAKITLTVNECRYPSNALNSDAFVHLLISSNLSEATLFEGWMIASSPALSAMEHPRYDVWVLRCIAAPSVE
ncbi:hypothetical protein GCM10007939_06420 [Amylibacter marinus]|uniref:DUF2155 domain-containing protein n=1 Tax=Amylibacter marinus TaxID=1475483 RepID=A0ABQ5VSQ2_9RHOB|nr:DUF2155 domain-containing protein [Amylibacter marinus]GLQ34359.1 hypothetical protein GCM10007939_06420 [Amylibacter marinus]